MTRLKTGIERVEWASPFPATSSSSQPKSCAAPMTGETAVRSTVVHISSVTAIRRLQTISRPTGSEASREGGKAGRRVLTVLMTFLHGGR
jgi:hypothetical protein